MDIPEKKNAFEKWQAIRDKDGAWNFSTLQTLLDEMTAEHAATLKDLDLEREASKLMQETGEQLVKDYRELQATHASMMRRHGIKEGPPNG